MTFFPSLCLCILWIYGCLGWHIYDTAKDIHECSVSETIANKSKTAPLSEEEIHAWNMWPGLMSPYDKVNGESIFGYREALDIIWRHQHPVDCKTAKFLVADGWDSGFGSEIHVLGQIMALAFRMNRVFTLSPDRALYKRFKWWTNNTFCKSRGEDSILCYYEPLTSCTAEDIYGPDGFNRQKFMEESKGKPNEEKSYVFIPDIGRAHKTWNLPQKFLVMDCWMGNADQTQKYIPDVFMPLLKCSPIPDKWHFYWWRALTASYIMRPNKHVRELMLRHREHIRHDHHKDTCVSIYVRRGDKHVEMEMVPISEYVASARNLENQNMLVQLNRGDVSSHRHIYFGSEDFDALQEIKEWSRKNGWKLHHSEFFDRRHVTTGLRDYDKQNLLVAQGADVHDELEYFAMIYDLDRHLKCEAFVCTMASNFCRLIDEMRATIAGKANRHYVDIQCGVKGGCVSSIDKPFDKDLGW